MLFDWSDDEGATRARDDVVDVDGSGLGVLVMSHDGRWGRVQLLAPNYKGKTQKQIFL